MCLARAMGKSSDHMTSDDSLGASVNGNADFPECYQSILAELQSYLQWPQIGDVNPDVQQPAGNGSSGRRAPKGKEKEKKKWLGVQKKIGSNAINGDINHSQREKNAVIERERRRNMHVMFATLQSLLPSSCFPNSKKDQCSVLNETIKYIPLAVCKLKELKSKKALLLLTHSDDENISNSATSANDDIKLLEIQDGSSAVINDANSKVAVNTVSGNDGELAITISTTTKFGALSDTLDEIEKHGLEVIKIDVFQSNAAFFRYIQAKHDRNAPALPSCETLRRRLEQIAFTTSL